MPVGDVYQVRMTFEALSERWQSTLHFRDLDGSADGFNRLNNMLRADLTGYVSVWRPLIGSKARYTCNQIRRVDPAPEKMEAFFFVEPTVPVLLIGTLPVVLGMKVELWCGDDEPTARSHFWVSALNAISTTEGVWDAVSYLAVLNYRNWFRGNVNVFGMWEHVLPRTDGTGFDRVLDCLISADVTPARGRDPDSCALNVPVSP